KPDRRAYGPVFGLPHHLYSTGQSPGGPYRQEHCAWPRCCVHHWYCVRIYSCPHGGTDGSRGGDTRLIVHHIKIKTVETQNIASLRFWVFTPRFLPIPSSVQQGVRSFP